MIRNLNHSPQNAAVSFRQWTRKNYAVFNSLKRIVKICCLLVSYAILSEPVFSQNEVDTIFVSKSIDLEETIVESARVPLIYNEVARIVTIITAEEIAQMPVKGLSDLLNYAVNTDIRQRGIHDIQSDVSLRGGSFEQTLILLNGIQINDPQTGHHNLDLPVSIENIEKIEILQGPGSRIFGPNAFSGAINIITKNNIEESIHLHVNAGSFNTYTSNISGNFNTGKITHYVSGTYKKSGGYIENTDFGMANLYHQSSLEMHQCSIRFQTGYTHKKFGANGFYTSAFPEQFEKTKTYFASVDFEKTGRINYRQNIYYRRHQDRFQLKRFEPAFYTNNHLTHIIGSGGNAYTMHHYGKTSVGWELRSEQILSNTLGEEIIDSIEVPGEPDYFFYRQGKRHYFNVFAEHFYQHRKNTFSAGLLANISNGYGLMLMPGIDYGFQITQPVKFYITVNQSFRLPSYTELYYKSPIQLGNVNLSPEKSFTTETGIKYLKQSLKVDVSIFHRNGTAIIDWVRKRDTMVWQALNHTRINTFGASFTGVLDFASMHHYAGFLQKLEVSYSYLDQRKYSDEYLSKYVMDYLKHKFLVRLMHKAGERLSLSWIVLAQDRAGSYTEFESGNEVVYNPFVTLDMKAVYSLKQWKISLEAMNIFNTEYYDFGNLEMPGFHFRFGVNYALNYK